MPPSAPKLLTSNSTLSTHIYTLLTRWFPTACSSHTGIITIHLLSKLATQAYKLAHLPQLGTETVGACWGLRAQPLQCGAPRHLLSNQRDLLHAHLLTLIKRGGECSRGTEGQTCPVDDSNKLQSTAIGPQACVCCSEGERSDKSCQTKCKSVWMK